MNAAVGRPLVRVVKVGGSLLDWPQLPQALQRWLDQQPPGWNVLLAGGGELTDAIRRADATFALGEETSHQLCIHLLGTSARLLAAVLREPGGVGYSLGELGERVASSPTGQIVFDPQSFLASDEVLPHDWKVTSDSIAARLAEVLEADELVLLKSVDSPVSASASGLASAGIVDAYFPQAALAIKSLRVINLRSAIP